MTEEGPRRRPQATQLNEASTRIGTDFLIPPEKPFSRLDSIDLLRGLVMVIMALDHVRDYFTDARFYPLDLSQTTVALALTRWITHFCAPVFVFLAGTGAFLSLTRGKTRKELSYFLVTRGLWLVLLEFTVIRFGWMFNVDYTFTFVQVIWAIGCSMIALSVLILLPPRVVGIFGLVMIATHNLFDGVSPAALGAFGWLWQILHAGGPIHYAQGFLFLVGYPLIPWIGVMAAGYWFGAVFRYDRDRRRKVLLQWGFGLIALFVVIRGINMYGDPHPWSTDARPAFTILSFINCEKYPPSLDYLLMTLGPAIALLVVLEKWKGIVARFFITFGRVPLFFYILHIPLIHLLALIAASLTGNDTALMTSNIPPWDWPPGFGFSLPVVYLIWIGIIIALYPACKWFAGLRRRRKEAWLSYL